MEDLQQTLSKGCVPQWALDHGVRQGLAVINHKPHMPCYPLCSFINRPEKMWRPHLSCTICPIRRYHYGKLNLDEWVLVRSTSTVERRYLILATAPNSGSIMPKRAKQYYSCMVNAGGRFGRLRTTVVRVLLQISEKLAQWGTIAASKPQKKLVASLVAPKHGVIMPRNYEAYFYIINLDDPVRHFRFGVIRIISTITEWIAQW